MDPKTTSQNESEYAFKSGKIFPFYAIWLI